MRKSLIMVSAAVFLFNSLQKANAQNTFPSTGKVGIGTTAPNASSLLEIKSTSKGVLIPRMTLAQRNAIAAPATSLMIYQTDNTPGFYYYSGKAWINVGYWKGNATGSTIYTNGKVGIGTSSPGYRLSVQDSGNAIYATSLGGGYGVYATSTFLGVFGSGGSYGIYGSGSYGVYGAGGTYGVYGYGTYGMYGSGTYGVYGSGYTYGVYGSASGNYGVYGSGFYGVYGYTPNGYGGTFISDAGHGLYAKTSSTASNIYAAIFQGNTYCYGTYNTSDERVKKNVADFKNGMDLINQLKPKSYDFRDDGSYAKLDLPKGNHYGFLAQDVEKLLPGLVREAPLELENAPVTAINGNGKDTSAAAAAKGQLVKRPETMNVKAINYTELIPVIIKGMQEMDAENKSLKTTVANLQDEVTQLKQMVQNSANANASGNTIFSANASLQQNQPNPFTGTTIIPLTVPASAKSASLAITETGSGKLFKTITVTPGMKQVNVDAGILANGSYTYTLIVDGKKIDSRQMTIIK